MALWRQRLKLRVLLIEEEGGWSAQALEYDIAAQAKTLTEVRKEFERVVIAQLFLSQQEGKAPFEGIPQAPQKFFDMYEQTDFEVQSKRPDSWPKLKEALKGSLPPTQFRVAEGCLA